MSNIGLRIGRRLRTAPFVAALLIGGLLGATACSDDPGEPTTAALLAELEGRRLTPAEIAEREKVAAVLCRLDNAVLLELWSQLTTAQLEFQDFVFGRHCPDRNQLYGDATGRFTQS